MTIEPTGAAGFQERLRPWADAVRRDLPWRRTRDPWAILVAEVMLQQTQVARVIPKWLAFLDRFPTAAACASASQADVVRAWEGLGYHRRAVALHRAAHEVCELHDGDVPSEYTDLIALAGIGPYTARAVRTFAYELDDAVLDTNVARIVARACAGERCTPQRAQAWADSLVPQGEGWTWNQGMLDLGAMLCRKRAPTCATCPVADVCLWRIAGNPEPDPAVGSAGVSGGQSRFAGSDRQGRGRILDALRRGPVALAEVDTFTGWSDALRSERVAHTLVVDGLAELVGATLQLR